MQFLPEIGYAGHLKEKLHEKIKSIKMQLKKYEAVLCYLQQLPRASLQIKLTVVL